MDLLEITDWKSATAKNRLSVLSRPNISRSEDLDYQIKEIINNVRFAGDEALKEMTLKYDDVSLSDFKMTLDEIDQAIKQTPQSIKKAIKIAIANVTKFHKHKMETSVESIEVVPGVLCGEITKPINSVGLYVPSGNNPLTSTAIMLGVPSLLAKCPQRILCSPPNQEGLVDSNIVTAATACGISDIYKIGGAQAIAAMAYGTKTIPKVDKIFGPGSTWVTIAKSLIASNHNSVSIDMPAGPTEVMVISDGSIDPSFVAFDLLSQAEHGPDSQVILICTNRDFAEKVKFQVHEILDDLNTKEIALQSLKNSRVILVDHLDNAFEIANSYAPEHLIVALPDARQYLDSITNAGSIFLGYWSPESAGDYCSGTNHVLPTYGYAKSISGISVSSFTKSISVQELTRSGLARLSSTIIELARAEGLEAHARAVEVRLEN